MNSQLNNSDYTKHSNSNWIEERKNDIGITSSFLMDSSNNEIGEIMSLFNTRGFAVVYEKARPFSEGMAAVYQHFYWRFINSNGEFVGGK